MNKTPWQTEEEWRGFGLEHYNGRNPTSLARSDDPKERSWYSRGSREGWIKNFLFERQRKDKTLWVTKDEWREFGFENYKDRTTTSLQYSKNPEERSWYSKGRREGWLKGLSFLKARNPKGYLKKLEDWKFYEQEIRKVIEENGGEFPTRKRFVEMKRSSLLYAVKYHGNLHEVKEQLGYNSIRMPPGYLDEWENCKKEILRVIKENSSLNLNTVRLRELGINSLLNAAKFHGGFPAVKSRLEAEGILQPRENEREQLERLLESYVND